MGSFVTIEQDGYRPLFGDINWTPRLNGMLEATGVELTPVGYREEGKPVMQINQENCAIYINQVADEMDCIAVKYDQDEDDIWTFYYREKFEESAPLEKVVAIIGTWATQIITLYPMEHIVDRYEAFNSVDLNDLPDWLPEV